LSRICRVVSLIKDNNQAEPAPARKAIYTSVLRCVGEQTICLFFTGRQHAGENLDDLLALRDPVCVITLFAGRICKKFAGPEQLIEGRRACKGHPEGGRIMNHAAPPGGRERARQRRAEV